MVNQNKQNPSPPLPTPLQNINRRQRLAWKVEIVCCDIDEQVRVAIRSYEILYGAIGTQHTICNNPIEAQVVAENHCLTV